jgi:endonuclease III
MIVDTHVHKLSLRAKNTIFRNPESVNAAIMCDFWRARADEASRCVAATPCTDAASQDCMLYVIMLVLLACQRIWHFKGMP